MGAVMSEPLHYHPTPIRMRAILGYSVHTHGDSYVPVAHVFADAPDGEEMAEQLVLRYNVHDPLIAALNGLLTWADSGAVASVLGGQHSEDCGWAEVIEAARAALSLERGEGS